MGRRSNMTKLNKENKKSRTIEAYASGKSTTICVCNYCTCPPPSVPNDVQMQRNSEVARSKTVAGS